MKEKQKLFWQKEDIENRCFFRGEKFTGVNLIFSFLSGVVFFCIVYGILRFFYKSGNHESSQFIDMFFRSSSIPYATVFLTCWSLAILCIKSLKLRVQQKALQVDILPDSRDFVLTSHTAREIIEKIHMEAADPEHFVLLDRIERALSNLKNLGNVSAVSECLKNQAENDESCLSSSYTVLKGFVWAIPVLGFIGTVVGLSEAVGKFGKTVSKQNIPTEKIMEGLSGVTSGLGLAFETTLIALVLALIVQLLITFVMHKEEKFLDDCSDYCHKHILSRMKSMTAQEQEE